MRTLIGLLMLLVGLELLTIQAVAQMPAEAQVRGNPQAVVGGVRRERFSTQPASLHPLNATDAYGNNILDQIYESLAGNDMETLDHIPLLASSWEFSADKKVITFHINPKAKWQDGKPVTAEDVKFSFDVLFHPKLKTRAKWMAYYSNFDKVEAVNAKTVRFVVKKDHFLNFINVAGLRIVPKHKFKNDDPNRTPLTKKPMGSGPYKFDSWTKGSVVKLRRHDSYWGWKLPQNVGRYNPKQALIKIIATDKVALETLKKGELDQMGLTPEQWMRETTGEPFGMGVESGKKLIKMEIKNKSAKGYRYVGYNLESPLFSDKRVRWAIGHLFDRETYIKKFYYGFQVKAVGPFEVNSRYSSPQIKPQEFSIAKAIQLLGEAGWKDTDGDRILDKDGRPFRFTIMTADPETGVKMLTLAKETMKKAGVELNIKVVDWTSFLQLIDEFKFDAVMLGWTRSAFPDPTALWHSKSAVQGGLNLVRYKNPKVDKLIDEAVKTIPDEKRVKLYRQIHELIFADQPYTFLLEPSSSLLAYNSRWKTVKPWYNYSVGDEYWWVAKTK